jgi:hypothetical protein
MRFILREQPEITIWYHQHEALVFKCKGRLDIQRRYAKLVGLPLDRHHQLFPGTAPAWENYRLEPSTAFAVELPAGALTPKSTRRHAHAVMEVSRMLLG